MDVTTTTDIPAEDTKSTTYGAQSVIVSSATEAGYEQAALPLRPGGTMVCVGVPKDTSVIAGVHPIMMCMKELNVVGSVANTLRECDKALKSTARGLVCLILTHGGLEDMNAGQLFGRVASKIAA